IAHHYTPLSLVVRAARQAETLAKNRYGRNALVVTVMRRSGEQTRVGCHWHYDSLTSTPEAQPIALFSRFYELFKRDVLSPKCLYILLEEATTLIGLERAAQSSEIKRVLRRQRADDQKDQLPDDQIQHLADNITRLAEAMDNEHNGKERAIELHADQLRYGLVETLGWLLVAEFLTRKGQHE
ncbi:MAG: hypothetical protein IMW89_13580, partial [Ktedonobacteraceae bacterium]|nr:hypothetical protein [Ktedonobacteraceae bacterium]